MDDLKLNIDFEDIPALWWLLFPFALLFGILRLGCNLIFRGRY